MPKDDWQPQLVVINQGTNDGSVPSERFRPAYDRYLGLIRAAYPAAHILALRPFNGAHAEDIRAVIEQRIAAGDTSLQFVDTTGWLDSTIDTTDGVHPDAMGHRKATERLEAEIRAVLARFDVPPAGVVE